MSDCPTLNRVFICLGSNINAEANLPAAVRLLQNFGAVRAASTVYETLPVGYSEQANFLNAAVLLETSLSLEAVLDEVVPEIEQALRRVRDRANPYGPRTIDLDVVLFNDAVIQAGHRELPDPDIVKYAFVAIPLAELEPDYMHPLSGETLRSIASRHEVATGDMRPRHDVSLI